MKRIVLLVLALVCSHTVFAAPPARERIPEPLRPWIDWVLHGHEESQCPFFQGEADHRECTWPSRLALEIDDRSGRFSQEWLAYIDTWVLLPGDARVWPLDVRIDGAATIVTAQAGAPAVRLSKGRHTVSGQFSWDAPPPLLHVPRGTGLLRLTLRGRAVPFPARDAEGRVWLEKPPATQQEASHVEVVILRHLLDDVPPVLTTRIDLAVSGESREELFGPILPSGFAPLAISGGLPARIEADGRLRLQLRPGRHRLDVVARQEGPASVVEVPKAPPPWDQEEIWVFVARPDLRIASIENVPGIDPQQTTLPDDWRVHPAYLVKGGDQIRIVEKRRGDSDPAPDQLTLTRTWWLDFDGKGATMRDAIEGRMSRGWRLTMPTPFVLGRVAIDGQDQFVTRQDEESPPGVEIRQGMLHLEADSRVEERPSNLPVVGWDQDFSEVTGRLNLGPGWRLFHAFGVDDVAPTWISSWNLLDMFLVLILTLSAARLWGRAAGILALATLGLTWVEPGAPRWTWVALIASEALWRLIPEGRFRRAIHVARGLAFVALVLIAIPFMVRQARVAIYPALEFEYRGSGGLGVVIGEGEEEFYRAQGGFAQVLSSGVTEYDAVPAESSDSYSNLLRHDPQAVVQTGPGLPDWTWRAVSLRWRGPVERTQHLRLVLIPPLVSSLLMFLRLGLVLAFALLILDAGSGGWRSLLLRVRGSRRAAPAALVLFLGVALAAPAAAEIPSPEMLENLRKRLLEKPACFPECASIPRLHLEADADALRARLELLVAASTAVPLPAVADEWPQRVLLDDSPAALRRDGGGRLWLHAGPGTHQVVMEGPLPDRDTIEITMPLPAHRATTRAAGWRVIGLMADGIPEGTLQLVRERPRERGPGLEPSALPPFVLLAREITMGLQWSVRTRVVRMSPSGAAIVLEVPLLPGESVTTPEVRAKDGKALVSLGPTQAEASWESTLAETPELTLRAPDAAPWTEVWRLAVGSIWHAEVEGIPVVHAAGEGPVRQREWHPWPGESVTVRIARPVGTPGRTLTLEHSHLKLSPGLRAMDATLQINTRSSRGGDHTLTLPDGATLQSLSIGGTVVPVRQDGRSVTLPISPGLQLSEIVWREPRGIGMFFRSTEVGLGEASVNSRIQIDMPADRWTLFLGGPRQGPAVNFWSVLFVSLLVSIVLGATGLTPLAWYHWFLLSLGLTQAPLPVALLVAVWLFALAARKNRSGVIGAVAFNASQVLLAGLTLVSLFGLFWSVKRGLLGLPEMQIAGNGSHAQMLAWYQDRAEATLPQPWAFSVPLLYYRLAMLAWSMWLAMALLRWLTWGWSCFAEGGLWRRIRRIEPPPDPVVPLGKQS